MQRPNAPRLDSWKEIAGFLQVDIRTARRWECERGLPVYRVPGGGRRAVYADPSEIEAWLRSDRLPAAQDSLPQGPEALENQTPAEPVSESGSFNHPHAGFKAFRREKIVKRGTIALVAIGVCLLAVAVMRSGYIRKVFAQLGETRVDSVSPIYDKLVQAIVIRGHGFGPRPRTIRMDSASGALDTFGDNNQTSLVILNRGEGAHDWIAGRASEVNHCDISVRLEEWTDGEIVISGFSGPLGSGCGERYQISPGDQIEVQVFGPSNQCGPGGIPNCPGEVTNGHIGVFPLTVQPAPDNRAPCKK